MLRICIICAVFLGLSLAGCTPAIEQPASVSATPQPWTATATEIHTATAEPTTTPTETLSPTDTPVPSSTPIPPTSTPVPQPLLLRRPCGRDHTMLANMPLLLYYGGWGVLGQDLAEQWMTNLTVELTIDDQPIAGELQPYTLELPYNCRGPVDNLYWLYHMAYVPGLAAGDHVVRMRVYAIQALPDGSGATFGPGLLLENTFVLMAR